MKSPSENEDWSALQMKVKLESDRCGLSVEETVAHAMSKAAKDPDDPWWRLRESLRMAALRTGISMKQVAQKLTTSPVTASHSSRDTETVHLINDVETEVLKALDQFEDEAVQLTVGEAIARVRARWFAGGELRFPKGRAPHGAGNEDDVASRPRPGVALRVEARAGANARDVADTLARLAAKLEVDVVVEANNIDMWTWEGASAEEIFEEWKSGMEKPRRPR